MDYFNWKVKTNYYGEDEYIKNIQEVLQKNYPLFFGETKARKKNKYISIITEDEGNCMTQFTKAIHSKFLQTEVVRTTSKTQRPFVSQESQRYCNYSLNKFNNELNFNVNDGFYTRNKDFVDEIFTTIEKKYLELTKKRTEFL
jgi:hypothetical protein